jgi:hypothetical protein
MVEMARLLAHEDLAIFNAIRERDRASANSGRGRLIKAEM